ncbi:TetR/AcrR family transcriptional regulator [Nonlabens agnitus]|uniref:TetR family transcriptional regulator n=1 Tax=Nonlabens agnitus TaxID=870484 RepID=A0A2S9WWZ2_9FLAO|nr:TetR/AcrR family transcriptional regulator [Nonlabens agnitus]PRP67961.1 TetR family transcriptional regulator [Nonlabens agnitus]
METKELILTESLDMFINHGFKSVTMDEIANKMGMSKKTLYTHYKNKSELVAATSLHMCHHICNGVEKISTCEDRNPIEELYEIKSYVMRELKGDNTSSIYQLQKYYPEIHKLVNKQMYDFMDNCIYRNVERGIDLGLYRDNIDKTFVARMYFIGIQGIKDISIFPVDQFPQDKLYDQYLEYHLRGIVTPTGRKILNQLTQSNHD